MVFYDKRAGRGGRGHGGAGGPIRPTFEDSGRDGARGGHKPDYHTQALCKQVRRAVSMALAGECADEVLQGLVVDEVMPAPNASRLLVRVFLRSREGGAGVVEVLERLARVQGALRARVGECIVRKRTPELVFNVIPIGPRGEVAHPEPGDERGEDGDA